MSSEKMKKKTNKMWTVVKRLAHLVISHFQGQSFHNLSLLVFIFGRPVPCKHQLHVLIV